MAKTTSTTKILRRRLGDSPELREMIADEKLNVHIARLIYDARTEAGLTQAKLAELVGTKQQAIARFKDADYQGHSLSVLLRITQVLGKRLSLSFLEQQV